MGLGYVCRLMAVVVALVLAGGCTRGKRHSDAPAEAKPAASTAEQKPAPTVEGDAWSRGVLPDEVLQGEPRSGGEVVIAVMQEPPSLNTLVDSDLMAAQLTEHHIYQALVRVDPYDDPRYRIVPELAERWEVSEDRKTYTFHLRSGVRFHDGTPLSSRDVVATMDKLMDETTRAAHARSNFAELQGYEAPDASTVVFRWKRPYFLALDTFAGLPIQPAHVIEGLSGTQYNEAADNPLNRHPVGTGPWAFDRWEANQKIVLRRNEHYWARPAYLDRLVVRFVKDATVRIQLAERGEADLVARLLDEHWARTETPAIKQRYHRVKSYDASYSWVGWNQRAKPFFADRRVRTALTQLIDRPGLAEKIFAGLPRLTTCHFYFASPDCDPSLKPLPYDPAAAARLLKDAGWVDHDGDGTRDRDGVPFAFTLLIPASSQTGEAIGTKAKEDLSRAGIDLDIQKVEWSVFTRRLREHEFDACYLGWGGSARQDPTQVWHSAEREKGSNYVGFADAEADRLIAGARVTLDDDARSAMYRKLGAILYREQPYTWLWVAPRLDLVSRRISGVRSSLYWWQFEDWWIAADDR